MNKYTFITENTRKKFFDAFWQLYRTDDLAKITVREICIIADYNRTTFYRYFTDITDILRQLEDDIIFNIKDSIKNNANSEFKFTYEHFKLFSFKYGDYIAVFHEKGNRRFYLKFKDLVKNDVYSYLDINVHDEETKEFLYDFLFSAVLNSYICWYKNQKVMSLEALVTLINGMIINGSKIILSYTK